MRNHHASIPAVSALLLLAIGAPAAEASVLTPTKPCYSRIPVKGSEPLTFTITGGVPGGRYTVSNPDGRIGSTSGTFDAAGNSTNAIQDFAVPGGGIDPRKGVSVPLQVTEYSGPYEFTPGTVTGGGNVTVTIAAIDISNKPYGKRYAKRTWTMSGLTPLFGRGSLHATWVRKGGSKATKIARLGRPDGCGYLRISRSASPSRRDGTWDIFVHVGKKLVKKNSYSVNWHQFHY